MREIQLTQSKVALVDDCDYEKLNQFKWCAAKNCNMFYAVRYTLGSHKTRHMIRMHHEVIGFPPKGFIADHINGVGTDNRCENLRHVTNRQNQQNRRNEKCSSSYPGVSCTRSNKWRSYIQINGKMNHLGTFITEEQAFEAYKQALGNIGETIVGEI